MIEYISTNKIFPHPDNPRKDLGDLKELKDSIKANGILQNLTIVPYVDGGEVVEDKYTVVIGHRRLSAAKLAKLEEVRCVVSDMDMRTQLATMLLENIQRSDLTLYEQAQGFQLMLDMGETASSIAKLTGFSKQTVKRRVKLLELDGDKLQEAVGRGGTLDDYTKLEEIEDVEVRNKILDKIGTNNFEWAVRNALEVQKKAHNKITLIKLAKTFAAEIDEVEEENEDGDGVENEDEVNKLTQVKSIWYGESTFEIPEDSDTVKYYFEADDWRLTIYRERTEEDDVVEDVEPAEKSEEEKRREQLKEMSEQAFSLRYDFIKSLSQSKAKKYSAVIIEYVIKQLIKNGYHNRYNTTDHILEMLGIELNDEEDVNFFDVLNESISKSRQRVLLVTVYCSLGDSLNANFHNWKGKYEENEQLSSLYDFLVKLGYEMSDEEQQLRDGTHEIFAEESADENTDNSAENPAEEYVDESADESEVA
jgi:ParB family chromosome partitioning protein